MRRRLCVVLAGLCLLGGAQAGDKPRSAEVLAITGKIEHANDGQRAVLDMAALLALPQHSFKTRTPWFPEAKKFSGPLLMDVLKLVGARGQVVLATALNDYRIELPLDELEAQQPIIALRLDGQPMSVRDKGPLWVMYNFDAKPEIRNERFHARSIWQLQQLDVR